jgi:hypothetical protein
MLNTKKILEFVLRLQQVHKHKVGSDTFKASKSIEEQVLRQ